MPLHTSQKRRIVDDSDAILPVRAPKHPRTSRTGMLGGDPSPSEAEGILSRWIQLARDSLVLGRDTFRQVAEAIKQLDSSLPTPSTSRQSSSLPQRGPSSGRLPHRPPIPLQYYRSMAPPPSPRLPSAPTPRKVDPAISAKPSSRPLPIPPPNDQRTSSSQDVESTNVSQPPPQTLRQPHSTEPPRSKAVAVPPKLRRVAHLNVNDLPVKRQPTASTSASVLANAKSAMPPPSIVPSAPKASTQLSTSVPPHWPYTRHGYPPELAAAIQGAEQRRTQKYLAQTKKHEHIFAAAHKAKVKETRKKERDEMSELYALKRSAGYSSNFNTFRGLLGYQERLELLDQNEALSPSPSLRDLHIQPLVSSPSRRHSFSEEPSSAFLKRALTKALQSLEGPAPLKPFTPSYEQLRLNKRRKDEEIERRLRPKPPPLPRSLPADDDAQVQSFLSQRGVISRCEREQVTDRDLSRLLPSQWLNDEIINFYGQMILSRSNTAQKKKGLSMGANGVNGVNGVNGISKGCATRGKLGPVILDVHYFSTFFWSKLKGDGYEKGRLAKWTKKFDIFSKDVLLIPINHNNSHWTGAAINFRRKRIESYDSMNMDRQNVYRLLREYLNAEHKDKRKKPFDFTGWIDYTHPETPQQENGYDCGVFTCQFLETLSRGEEAFNFTQRDMAYLRRRMIWEIGNARLREES